MTSAPAAKAVQFMTWNVLAETLTGGESFAYVDPAHLKWDNRKQQILKLVCQQDLACLQEVTLEQYQSWFEPQLAAQGYSGCFFPKTTKSVSQYYASSLMKSNSLKIWFHPSKAAAGAEIGNAIFWRDANFEALGMSYIPLTDLWWKCSRKEQGRKYSHPQVATIALLKCKSTKQTVMVVSTHIVARKPPEVQFAQVHFLLEQLYQMTQDFANLGVCESDVPILLAGDFNSLPNSAVYNLLSLESGWIAPTPTQSADLYGVTHDIPVQFPAVHYLGPMRSAYKSAHGEEPRFTNSVPSYQATVDYVWVRGNIQIEHVDKLSSTVTMLPSETIPSDHVPITCKFLIQGKAVPASPTRVSPTPIVVDKTPPKVKSSSLDRLSSSSSSSTVIVSASTSASSSAGSSPTSEVFSHHWRKSFEKRHLRKDKHRQRSPVKSEAMLCWRRPV